MSDTGGGVRSLRPEKQVLASVPSLHGGLAGALLRGPPRKTACWHVLGSGTGDLRWDLTRHQCARDSCRRVSEMSMALKLIESHTGPLKFFTSQLSSGRSITCLRVKLDASILFNMLRGALFLGEDASIFFKRTRRVITAYQHVCTG